MPYKSDAQRRARWARHWIARKAKLELEKAAALARGFSTELEKIGLKRPPTEGFRSAAGVLSRLALKPAKEKLKRFLS